MGLAIDHVTVNIQVVGESVVLTELFQLSKGIAHQSGVDNADVGGGVHVFPQGTRRGVGRRVVRNGLDIVHAKCRARGLDVAGDVFRFQRSCAGVNLEALNHPGVTRANHQRGDQQHGHTDDRQAPLARDRREQQENGNHRGDTGQNLVSGNDRIDFGETRTGREEALTLRDEGRVLIEPQARTLREDIQRCRDGNLDAQCARHDDFAARDANATINKARCRAHDKTEQQHSRNKRHHRLQEGQFIDEERDIESELRVGCTEGRAVHPLQNGGPVRGRAHCGQKTHGCGSRVHDEAAHRFDGLAVSFGAFRQTGSQWSHSERNPHGEPHGYGHAHKSQRADGKHRTPLGKENLVESGLLVPENVNIDRGETEECRDDDGQNGHGHDQRRTAGCGCGGVRQD